MQEKWQHIYSDFNPVAFHLGNIGVHWYGLMYALALITAIYTGHYFIKNKNYPLSSQILDNYIWWAELGVILGARLGYIIFYDTHTLWYLTHPWQIFNPFMDGIFVGISGMSYHGAVGGLIISTFLFCKKYKINFWLLTDLVALSVPLGYTFGRIANFLNQELVGRVTDVPWGIYVHGILRHPSALYEAFLEGIVIFVILYFYRTKTKFVGELSLLYVILYSTMRIISENFRQPDLQLGFLLGTSWLTMGILISSSFILIASIGYIYKSKSI